jgi:hypothetical protein
MLWSYGLNHRISYIRYACMTLWNMIRPSRITVHVEELCPDFLQCLQNVVYWERPSG